MRCSRPQCDCPQYQLCIQTSPPEQEVVRLRGACLQQLAVGEVSAPGTNWYLTEDLIMRGLEVRAPEDIRVSRIMSGDIQ